VASSPHDASFRFTFGLPENASAMLRSSLPSALDERVNWDTLDSRRARFVDVSVNEVSKYKY